MTNTSENSRFLKACRREEVDATPVWFMRQAGRYMPEYRKLREKYTLLEMVAQPEIAAEVTLQPIKAFGMDAAILFADILLPLTPMGVNFKFVPGKGPQVENPVRTAADVAALKPVETEASLGHVLDAIRILRGELSETPLIGFCGAPFTVASYMIEGGPSKDYRIAKSMMYNAPEVWHAFMEKLTIVLVDYLTKQIAAGAQAVQLFDSWVGALDPQDYETFAMPYSKQILDAAHATGVPVIHFGVGATTLLPLMKQAGGDVIGLDWRIPLDKGWEIVGHDRGVQGNLDPVTLFSTPELLEKRVKDVLRRADNRPGHIFNVGHGILQYTPNENVKAVVEMVHEFSKR